MQVLDAGVVRGGMIKREQQSGGTVVMLRSLGLDEARLVHWFSQTGAGGRVGWRRAAQASGARRPGGRRVMVEPS